MMMSHRHYDDDDAAVEAYVGEDVRMLLAEPNAVEQSISAGMMLPRSDGTELVVPDSKV
jgi:hypothetical protein